MKKRRKHAGQYQGRRKVEERRRGGGGVTRWKMRSETLILSCSENFHADRVCAPSNLRVA
eukprot:233005-Hanusia_phi.AAC.2